MGREDIREKTEEEITGSKKQPKPHPVDVRVGKQIRHSRRLREMLQIALVQQI